MAWTIDATSGKAIPQSSAEWTSFLASDIRLANWSAPDALHLLQDASGNAADAISSFTLTASGTGISYQQTDAGMTKKYIGTTDAGSGTFTSTSASLPDLSTGSVLMLIYAKVTSSGGTRILASMGTGANNVILNTTSTPRLRGSSNANTATGTVSPLSAIRPFFLQSDFTNAVTRAISDQEVLTPTRGTVSGKRISLGGGSTDATAEFFYCATWFTAHAERSLADMRDLAVVLGFAPSWTVAYAVALAESMSHSETATTLFNVVANLTESTTLSESVAIQMAQSLALAEPMTLSEAVAVIRNAPIALAESLAVSDAVVVQASDVVALAESVTLSESVATTASSPIALAESMAASDAVAVIMGATIGLAEAITIAEAIATALGATVALPETLVLSESLSLAYSALITLSEALALAESVTAARIAPIALAESMTSSDAIAAMLSVIANISETWTLLESLSALHFPGVIMIRSADGAVACVSIGEPQCSVIDDEIHVRELP